MFARGIIVLLSVLVAISDGARPPECDFPIHGCPKIYRPVCGTDGVTYTNECLLCIKIQESGTEISIEHDGPC